MSTQNTDPKPETALRIVRLTASNVMRLKAGAIDIVPKGNTVVLSGKNKNGKSAVLNSILFALAGKSVLPDAPVRKGALAADVHLDLGEIVVDWRCTAAKTITLTVRKKDGGEMKSPQTQLDALWNKMCDPVKFVMLSETVEGRRKQAEILRQIVSLDFTKLDAERKTLYDERTDNGRKLETQKALATSMAFHADAPEAEQDASEIRAELEKANTHNAGIQEVLTEANAINGSISIHQGECNRLNEEITGLEIQIATKRKQIAEHTTTIENCEAAREEVLKKIAGQSETDTAPIIERLASVDSVNQRVRNNAAKRAAEKKCTEVRERYDVLSRQIEEVDEEKRTALASAKFPVPGLSFDENGVLLDGVPFDQGSQAEQLVAATAIALALKPRIRVVLLRDASLLDSDTRKAVAELAARENAQVWEECVESSEENAIIIEDGAQKEVE